LLAGAETHAELVIRERAHLGAHAEVLVDAEILVDAAGEISRLLQLRWAHARSGVPDGSLPLTVNLTGGAMHNLIAWAPWCGVDGIDGQRADHGPMRCTFDLRCDAERNVGNFQCFVSHKVAPPRALQLECFLPRPTTRIELALDLSHGLFE